MKLINCPICDVKAPRNLITKARYPYFTSPISKKRKKELLEIYKLNSLIGTLDIKICNNCCHCFLSIPPDETILNLIYDIQMNYLFRVQIINSGE